MRILLIGRNGQLGWELARTLQTLGQVVAIGREQMDLEAPTSIVSTIRSIRPNLIINASAYTAVDQAETEEKRAYAINAVGPGIMAEEAKRIGAGIIHYSSDYVFDGTKEAPYTEEDIPNPLNVYGRSKLAGEQAIAATDVPHLILRTSWVYGARGTNFLKTVLRLASERDELRIVNDQTGAPTWSRLLAQATAHILATGRPLPERDGLYHLTASGATSWFGFARAILDHSTHSLNQDRPRTARLIAIPSSDYPTPAIRPANSQLNCDKLLRDFGLNLPDWMNGLHLCIQDSR